MFFVRIRKVMWSSLKVNTGLLEHIIGGSSHCGTVEMSLTYPRGCVFNSWHHSVGQGSRVSVSCGIDCRCGLDPMLLQAVMQACSRSSDWTPSLGTSICHGCGPKKQKKKTKTCYWRLVAKRFPDVHRQCTLCILNTMRLIYQYLRKGWMFGPHSITSWHYSQCSGCYWHCIQCAQEEMIIVCKISLYKFKCQSDNGHGIVQFTILI